MTTKTEKHALPAETMASGHLSTRREPRFPLRFEIEVCGFGPDSTPFRIRTFTMDVSEWGCRFEMPVRIEANSVFTIQALSDDQRRAANCAPVMFQGVRVLEFKGRWEVAAWKLAPEKVWPVELPVAPPEGPDEPVTRLRKDDPEH
jgi:hypothetical protein